MVHITVSNGETIQTNPVRSILNALLQHGIPIEHVCGGKAACGTCKIRILEGEQYLNPMTESERIRLSKGRKENSPPEHIRLACQTYAYRDIKIQILSPGK